MIGIRDLRIFQSKASMSVEGHLQAALLLQPPQPPAWKELPGGMLNHGHPEDRAAPAPPPTAQLRYQQCPEEGRTFIVA